MKKKLSLRKDVISNLEKSAMSKIKGGGGGSTVDNFASCFAHGWEQLILCWPEPKTDGCANSIGPTCGGAETCIPNACAADVTNAGGYQCWVLSVQAGIGNCN